MSEFGSIVSFAKMYMYNSSFLNEKGEKAYSIKPKLHGTFGKIVIKDNDIKFYSKNRLLSKTSDNAGFWNAHESIQQNIINNFAQDGKTVAIYGEWCGKGIHESTDAICQLIEKAYCVFAISVDDTMFSNISNWGYEILKSGWLPISPAKEVNINFNENTDQSSLVKELNDMVVETGIRDKWAKVNFGVDGTGEGFVGVLSEPSTIEDYFKYAFKAKTEAHRVKKTKDALTMNEPMPLDYIQFIDQFCTAARVRQAVSETQSLYDMSDTPKILSWVAKDIQKEGQDEMNSLGMEWKKIAKAVNQSVISMWKGMVNEEFNRSIMPQPNDTPASCES